MMVEAHSETFSRGSDDEIYYGLLKEKNEIRWEIEKTRAYVEEYLLPAKRNLLVLVYSIICFAAVLVWYALLPLRTSNTLPFGFEATDFLIFIFVFFFLAMAVVVRHFFLMRYREKYASRILESAEIYYRHLEEAVNILAEGYRNGNLPENDP